MDHLPEASAVRVPIEASSINISTVELGSAVPVTVGVLVWTVAWSAGAVIIGAAGAVVSIAMVTGALAGELLPAGSSWVAVIVWEPSERGVDGVHSHAPPACLRSVNILG